MVWIKSPSLLVFEWDQRVVKSFSATYIFLDLEPRIFCFGGRGAGLRNLGLKKKSHGVSSEKIQIVWVL